jgi:tetratricopeptide (TPR) repeat protein
MASVMVLGMKIAAAFRHRLAFAVEHRFSVATVIAGTAFREGQMEFGPAELHANVGLALLHLDEYEIALQSFDQAIRGELRDEVRTATLNNRGLAWLRLQNYSKAIADIRAALQL